MAGRLQRRGWPNSEICKQVQESASHIPFKCCFSIRVWTNVENWLALDDVDPISWNAMRSVEEWWNEEIHKQRQSKKAMTYLAMLVSWKVWKKRNTRVFQNNASTTMMVIFRIKEEIAF
jgi:hypothetical protein